MRPDTEVVLVFLAVGAGVAAVASLGVEVSEPEWEFQVLDNNTVGFTQVESGEDVHVVARTDQGLEHFTRSRSLLPVGPRPEFKNRLITEGGSSGSYASLEMVSGTPMVGFQYAEIGAERVKLGSWNGSAWRTDTVPGERGLNVGMGTELAALDGEPVLFYTGNGNEGLRVAERTDSNWTKRSLEPNAGVFTDAERCGESVSAVYSSRDSYEVSLGRLSKDSWNSRSINTTATSLDLATGEGCRAFIAAHSGSRNEVFVWNDSKHGIDTSVFSRTSADFGGGDVHTLYGRDGSGIYFGSGQGDQSIIYQAPGEYNDLEVQNGNRYAAFTNESKLVFGEYNTRLPETKRNLLSALRAVLLVVVVLASGAGLRQLSPFRRLREKPGSEA